jgi:hypothetical protein
MYYMKKSRRHLDELTAMLPPSREVMISFRLSRAHTETLQALAKEAGVGHTTLARLIVEKYLNEHASTGGRRS